MLKRGITELSKKKDKKKKIKKKKTCKKYRTEEIRGLKQKTQIFFFVKVVSDFYLSLNAAVLIGFLFLSFR